MNREDLLLSQQIIPFYYCHRIYHHILTLSLSLSHYHHSLKSSSSSSSSAADIVLTEPGLSTIVYGIIIARSIFARIRNFLTYRVAATLQLLVFFFIAVFAFRPSDYVPDNYDSNSDSSSFPDKDGWPEFFHMPVLMLMLITLLNDGTMIAIGYDNVHARDTPEKWNLKALFLVSTAMAIIACLSSLLLLFFSLDSWTPHHLYQHWGIGGLSYGQIITSMYLKISVSDFLTLFSARTGELWLWQSAPSWILVIAAGIALSASTILACSWPDSNPDGINTLGLARRSPKELAVFIWLYCIVWWFIQDAVKVGIFYIMKKYNWFHYNDTGKVELPESTLQYIRDHKAMDISAMSAKHH